MVSLQVKLVSPSVMPKLGKAGSLQSRQAIVHSLVHTESWAIDLSWVTLSHFNFFFVICVICYVFLLIVGLYFVLTCVQEVF